MYQENGLIYKEIIRQEYGGNKCIVSAGFVKGKNKSKVDIIYLKLEKNDVEPTILLLRPMWHSDQFYQPGTASFLSEYAACPLASGIIFLLDPVFPLLYILLSKSKLLSNKYQIKNIESVCLLLQLSVNYK